jgi:F0F1-type ATP synthase membrane subunit b/b'
MSVSSKTQGVGVRTDGRGGERETLERLAVDEAALEREIADARREAAAVVESARQEGARIAGEARAEIERELARRRAEAAAQLERALAVRRAELAEAVAALPRRVEGRRERAIARAIDEVLGRRT